MGKTFFIHLGMPKTGSSSIQYFLAKNKDLLLEKGLFYPNFYNEVENTLKVKIGSGNGHTISRVFQDAKIKTKGQTIDDVLKVFDQAMKECGDKNMLLTSEGLYRIKENHANTMIGMAKSAGFDIKAIIYIRRQDLALTSMYNQKVKRSGFITPFNEWLLDNYQKETKFNYHKLLTRLARIYGNVNLIIRPFEKQQFYQQDLIQDFMKHLELELTPEFDMETGVQNQSLSRKSVEMMNVLNVLDPSSAFTNHIMEIERALSEVAPVFGEKQHIDPNTTQEILAYFEKENEKTAKEFLGRIDGVLFKDKVKTSITKGEDHYTPQEVALLIGGLLVAFEKKLRSNEKKINNLMTEHRKKLKKGDNAPHSGDSNGMLKSNKAKLKSQNEKSSLTISKK